MIQNTTHSELLEVCTDIANFGNFVRPIEQDGKKIQWICESDPWLGMEASIDIRINNFRRVKVLEAFLRVEEASNALIILVGGPIDPNLDNLDDNDPLAPFILESFRKFFQPAPKRLILPFDKEYNSSILDGKPEKPMYRNLAMNANS